MRLRARELEGQRLPRWHGIAWHVYHLDEVVLLPIPFNLLARAGHALYWLAFRLLKFPQWANRQKLAYERGFAEGKRFGVAEGERTYASRMTRMLDEEIASRERRAAHDA